MISLLAENKYEAAASLLEAYMHDVKGAFEALLAGSLWVCFVAVVVGLVFLLLRLLLLLLLRLRLRRPFLLHRDQTRSPCAA